jgi:adenosylcobinamide amidohydrolase
MSDGIEIAAKTDGLLPGFVERREIRGPWIGLLTSAWTEKAVLTEAAGAGLTALAVVTVGRSNRIAAGQTPLSVWAPSTINAIVVVDGAPEAAALVNAVMTVTEVKTWVVARASREALGAGIRRWIEEHG